MKSTEVRERFLRYFVERGHRRVPSSSLIPAEDPTLLFTNAGMNQFKDVFTGREKREYARATTAQKCVRAGGKHNDLDNVGYTGRHHTFFEMLGNFSFGDYFKPEAIAFAWELITDPAKGYGLDPERLWATVFTNDDDAFALWERHLPKSRILRFGEKENFWAMGETGPCGPCSELHYFRGANLAENTAERVNGPGDDTLEIWNLVFMQFERDASGETKPLPKPSVDTGAGLERICAILQGVNNNFDTDLFAPILARIGELSGQTYRGGMAPEDAPFRVIADHVRAATMLIADGALPSNEGRGYVLRRILRRAMRYGRRLGLTSPFLYEIAPTVVQGFAGVYFEPATVAGISRMIAQTLEPEEDRFGKTLSEGADRIGEAIERLRREGATALSGETVFRFYDTYGIPLEVIEEIAGDEGVAFDRAGFEEALEHQRRTSALDHELRRRGHLGVARVSSCPRTRVPRLSGAGFRRPLGSTGCSRLCGTGRAVGLKPGRDRRRRRGPDRVLPGGRRPGRRPSEPGRGRQVARRSWTRRSRFRALISHRVPISTRLARVGATSTMAVPEWTRRRTQANHTGTHLLHAALRKVLGPSARQMGSLVAPGPSPLRLRGRVADDARADRRDRAARERGDPPGPAGLEGGHADGRGAPQGRRHVLRREVRRARARR